MAIYSFQILLSLFSLCLGVIYTPGEMVSSVPDGRWQLAVTKAAQVCRLPFLGCFGRVPEALVSQCCTLSGHPAVR